jgi:hypothetical protein
MITRFPYIDHDPKIRRIYDGKLTGVRLRECNTDKIIDFLVNAFIIHNRST